jgi:hypothetical protein
MSQSAQTGHVHVPHPGQTQGAGEHVATELRVVTRSWNGADVDDPIHAVSREQTDELADRSCRMPDSKDWTHWH